LGIVAVVAGLILVVLGRGFLLDRLPGDIRLEGRGWSCWIPLGLSLLLSLVLTVVLNLAVRLLNR
jgi:hypothetical protein